MFVQKTDYVYILSDYEEDGAENVTATLDRHALMSMVENNWPVHGEDEIVRDIISRCVNEAKVGLAEILAKTDEELSGKRSGWDCQSGWGGIQLHVVKLVR